MPARGPDRRQRARGRRGPRRVRPSDGRRPAPARPRRAGRLRARPDPLRARGRGRLPDARRARAARRLRGTARDRRRTRGLRRPMSGLRIAAALAAVVIMIPVGLLLAASAARTLHGLPRPAVSATPTASAPPPARERPRHDRHAPRDRRPRTAAATPSAPAAPARAHSELLDPATARLLVIVTLELSAATALLAVGAGGLAARRLRRRRTRRYELYELRLSTHDQAKPQDLEDMVETIANLIRAYPVERARDGQPHVGVELRCLPAAGPDPDDAEAEWSLNVRCEPRIVDALDAVINAAYPDVRLRREALHAP